MSAELFVVGTPLDEDQPLSPQAAAVLAAAQLYIGESRKVAMRYLSPIAGWKEKPLFLLDQQRPEDTDEMKKALRELVAADGRAALFSDCGMPVLFDPGEAVVQECRELGFRIRTCGSETSWGTAAALSGFGTPFLVVGFPPRENEERRRWLTGLKTEKAHLVLMDTPYRFTALLESCRETFGASRGAFLAWEIGKADERLRWASLERLTQMARAESLKKGEFVLVVRGAGGAEKGKPRANFR